MVTAHPRLVRVLAGDPYCAHSLVRCLSLPQGMFAHRRQQQNYVETEREWLSSAVYLEVIMLLRECGLMHKWLFIATYL